MPLLLTFRRLTRLYLTHILHKLLTLFFVLILLSTSSLAKSIKLKPGYWQCHLTLSEEYKLPFILKYEKKAKTFSIFNGSEEISLKNYYPYSDSLIIPFDVFKSELRVKPDGKKHINGFWYNMERKGNYKIPFSGKFVKSPERFPEEPSKIDVAGRWEVHFDPSDDDEIAIGLFEKLDANKVSGTFLTETGDYRFLEGATINDSLYLSTFDGSHAFLFGAALLEDTLKGFFKSGVHYEVDWFAVRNENIELRNPDSLTYLVNDNPVTFELPDLNGGMYSFPNEDSEDKVTIIQIMGTWCPNCWDESLYLKTLSEKHGDNLNIVAVTFETPETLEGKIEKVVSYKANLGLNYTFVIGGNACKPCANELFPQLNKVISFPTMIVLDKNGMVRKIHTGFNGPGTGDYYTNFVSSTNAFIEALINE